MAVAFVQKSAQLFGDNVSSIAPSLASTTAGNFVALVINNDNGDTASPATGMSPPAGWSDAISPNGAAGGGMFKPVAAIFYKENIAGGTESGTVTVPASSYCMATIVEFSGVAASSSLDVTASSSASAVTSGNTGTTAATALADSVAIVVGGAEDGTGAVTNYSTPATTGYTTIYNSSSAAVHAAGDHSYKILSATGTQSGAWTWTTSAVFAAVIAVFKGVAPPSPLASTVSTFEVPYGRNNFFSFGFNTPPLAPNFVSLEMASSSYVYALPPIGADFNFDFSGFSQSPSFDAIAPPAGAPTTFIPTFRPRRR